MRETEREERGRGPRTDSEAIENISVRGETEKVTLKIS